MVISHISPQLLGCRGYQHLRGDLIWARSGDPLDHFGHLPDYSDFEQLGVKQQGSNTMFGPLSGVVGVSLLRI